MFKFDTPWVQSPLIPEVQDILRSIKLVNYKRGSGLATKRLSHLEILYRDWVKEVINLSEFKFCYFVNGVTDALNQWIATETREWIYSKGDYEYPKWIGGKGSIDSNSEDLLYVSNPSCIDGNLKDLSNIENPVILDCAYIGSTSKTKISVPKNTEQIFFSFSKGWGLVGTRCGLVFTKKPHKSLRLMKKVEGWNYTGVDICIKICETFDIDTIYNLYKDRQKPFCDGIDNIEPSDCFYIANSTSDVYKSRMRDGKNARLCISEFL